MASAPPSGIGRPSRRTIRGKSRTVEQACAHLAKRGYLFGVTDYSGPMERSFERTIRSSQALRHAFYKAESERVKALSRNKSE